MPRTIIITGGESGYLPLLEGLLRSIESTATSENIDLGLLDLGLNNDQTETFKRRGVSVVVPEWDVDLSLFEVRPKNFFKGMTARPHLRKYFPGYDVYLWMDADTWVQDWSGIRLYISSALTHGFAATPEIDRSYSSMYGNLSVISWRHNWIKRCFNTQVANKLAAFPIVNCGVFAARSDAPHWDFWASILTEIFKHKREALFFAEQTALNVVIRESGVATALLPAICNWMCNRALPSCSDDGNELREPHPPFQRISVVHLTANTKNGIWQLATTNGVHSRSLRFGGNDVTQVGPDVTVPNP